LHLKRNNCNKDYTCYLTDAKQATKVYKI